MDLICFSLNDNFKGYNNMIYKLNYDNLIYKSIKELNELCSLTSCRSELGLTVRTCSKNDFSTSCLLNDNMKFEITSLKLISQEITFNDFLNNNWTNDFKLCTDINSTLVGETDIRRTIYLLELAAKDSNANVILIKNDLYIQKNDNVICKKMNRSLLKDILN
jgi:hypothetical protein